MIYVLTGDTVAWQELNSESSMRLVQHMIDQPGPMHSLPIEPSSSMAAPSISSPPHTLLPSHVRATASSSQRVKSKVSFDQATPGISDLEAENSSLREKLAEAAQHIEHLRNMLQKASLSGKMLP